MLDTVKAFRSARCEFDKKSKHCRFKYGMSVTFAPCHKLPILLFTMELRGAEKFCVWRDCISLTKIGNNHQMSMFSCNK